MAEAEADTDTNGAVAAAVVGGVAVGGAVGGAAAVPVVVTGVHFIGFGTGGIGASTWAASIMSAEAIAGGGGVAAGGWTATLQSIGATGALSAGAGSAVIAVGALAGAASTGLVAGYFVYKLITHKPDGQTPEKTEGTEQGRWMVVTEEGWGNVVFYLFNSEEEATRYFDGMFIRARALLDPFGRGLRSAGLGRTMPTIRAHYRHSPHNSKVGFAPAWLTDGCVIVLHSPAHNRFIRMDGEQVNAQGGQMDFEDIPNDWRAERFTVVAAGNGEFAFHSTHENRFLRLMGDEDGGGGIQDADALPEDWGSERFVVVDAGDGLIALHSSSHNRFVRLCGQDVNAKGSRKDAVSLPDAWDSERFQVKIFP